MNLFVSVQPKRPAASSTAVKEIKPPKTKTRPPDRPLPIPPPGTFTLTIFLATNSNTDNSHFAELEGSKSNTHFPRHKSYA